MPSAQRPASIPGLYVSLALLGIASLAIAASSSLLPWTNSGTPVLAGPVAWAVALASAAYGLSALCYGLGSFRSGTLPRVGVLGLVVAVAAAIHLSTFVAGLWRMPETGRTFDVTLASLLVLELSVSAVLGWANNAALRRRPSRRAPKRPGREPSAAALVGTLFAASILVASLTTAGMAASTAGELAVPHSGHGDSGHGDSGHGGSHDEPTVPSNLQQLKEQGHHH